jgi:hypothetical protein
MDRWTSRLHSKGEDPFGLGRWSYITLRGKLESLLTIISAYQVSQKSAGAAGPKTAYMQQFKTLLASSNAAGKSTQPEPNRQFLLDLHAWKQHLHASGHQVILNLDNNTDLYSSEGSLHSNPYDPTKVTSCPQHDGSLATLAQSCGLVNILAVHHSQRPFPPTYIRGRKRLDYMLVSASLQSFVIRSGILPYHSIFPGDHRPCFLDLDGDLLFAGSTQPLSPPCRRSLQLHDPRKIDRYKTTLHEQLTNHKVLDKCQDLLDIATKGEWSLDFTIAYEKLDKIFMESMLYAEKVCSKKFTKLYEWPPCLIQAVEVVCFWRLLLKRANGVQVSQSSILQSINNANIPVSLSEITDSTVIVWRLRLALQQPAEISCRIMPVVSLWLSRSNCTNAAPTSGKRRQYYFITHSH